MQPTRIKTCLLLLMLLMSSCSAQWHLQKAVKKDPAILEKKVITVTDTVVTEPIVVKDTVTLAQTDTVEIVKDRFRVKIIRSFDTLMIDGGCEADTIIRTVEVPVETFVYKEKDKWYHKVQAVSMWILIVLIVVLALRSKIDKILS